MFYEFSPELEKRKLYPKPASEVLLNPKKKKYTYLVNLN